MAPDGPSASTAKTPKTAKSEKDERDALRAKLHDEIEEKSRACGHRRYACHLPRLAGRARCRLHILEDPTAPFKRCRYAGARRCTLPAPVSSVSKHKDSGLCFEHARTGLISRMRNMSKKTPKPSPEAMLLKLKHYIAPERTRTESVVSEVSVVSEAPDPADSQMLAPPDPFKRIDAAEINAAVGPSALDCWSSSSDSEDDDEPRRNCGVEEDSSGAEDTPLDSDPLRFAGIYTAEEVVRETGAALDRLKSLYVGQLKVLTRRLKESRRAYLYGLKSEKEAHCSIHAQGASTASERRELATLKAMNSYRRRHGIDAVMQRKLYEKRARATEGTNHRPTPNRCCFTEGGVKCAQPALPAARHCLKHILNDKQQVLFRECGANKAGIICQEPIPALNPTATCIYHTDLLPYQTFSLKKCQSDTDDSDIEVSNAAIKPNEP